MSKPSKKAAAAASSNAASASAAGGGASSSLNVTLVLPFPSIPLMSLHLSRVSAFVEDPVHASRPLRPEQLVEHGCPAVRYAGHNFTLQAFQKAVGALAPLTTEENNVVRAVTEAVKPIRARATAQGAGTTIDVYIIAHVASDERTYAHERCHAIYHYCEEYRKRVSGIWSSLGGKAGSAWSEQFTKHLGGMYHTDVHVDEFQAIVLNREYECAQKTVNLLQAAMPPDKTLPFTMTTINIPIAPATVEKYANVAIGATPPAK